MQPILVIRYGGFGDIVLSMAAFRTIRAHHQATRIAALTTPRFRDLLEQSGYFDEIVTDRRRKFSGWIGLVRQLRRRRFSRVYDLQRNTRTTILYRALGAGRRLEWSGVIPGSSHFVADDPDDRRHIVDRLAEQLAIAGIPQMLPADLAWLTADLTGFALPQPYALLVPGGAPHRPEKRAPAECFAALARHLKGQGVAPVLLGTASERQQIDTILAGCPDAIDLSERTSFGDIAELARHAVGAIGNDTGPMHLAAAVGCPSLVLFSAASDPCRIAPRGRHVEILQTDELRTLEAARLIAAWEAVANPAAAQPA
ncbi:MAG TPA: glycosyltransferase family 9 protein [Stellaceae bacterium]|nr:glycosyltransferase family 9 protein [Stellaceae bacterium]